MSPEAMNLAQAGLVCLCKSNSMGGYVSDARQGKARQGKARQGKAGQGRARQGNLAFPWQGTEYATSQSRLSVQKQLHASVNRSGAKCSSAQGRFVCATSGGWGGDPTNHAIFCQERTD